MSKIVTKSAYGFRLDSLKNGWDKVDKDFLKTEMFKALTVGMDISTVRNKDGFVTSVKVNSLPNANEPLKSNPSRDILKGQCLNIIFANLSAQEVNLENDKMRDQGIRYSQKLFMELEAAEYYKW